MTRFSAICDQDLGERTISGMSGQLCAGLLKLAGPSNSLYLMLEDVIFYTLEKTIKRYRQFAQHNIDQAGFAITIDQWLVLNVIQESPALGQTEIAERVFKDQASVARIIELLVKKNLLIQTSNQQDRRRIDRVITSEGKVLLLAVGQIVAQNRRTALQNLSEPSIEQLRHTLEMIFGNCPPPTTA